MSADRQLAKEIEFDLRKFEEEQEEAERRRQEEANRRSPAPYKNMVGPLLFYYMVLKVIGTTGRSGKASFF